MSGAGLPRLGRHRSIRPRFPHTWTVMHDSAVLSDGRYQANQQEEQ